MKFKHYTLTVLATVLLTTLNGCGGGGSENTSSVSNDTQPHTLSANDLTKVNVLSSKLSLEPTVVTSSDSITLTFSNIPVDIVNTRHFQFFLNVDNDSSTGFQFDNYAWNNSGVDYLIEDGGLFKSTSDQWSWEYVDVSTNYTSPTPTSRSITLKKSWLEGLSNKLHIGMIIRDNNWAGTDFYPISSQMAVFDIDVPTPTDTEAPVITLKGSKVMELEQTNQWIPGATAIDNMDGDISNNIITTGSVDTSVIGMYELVYSISDKAGNSSSVTRIVNIIGNAPKSIVVDGIVNDWSYTQNLIYGINGGIRVSNDGMMLNIFIKAKNIDDNTQIFIDTDNNSSTGIQFWGSEWNVGGADYMVENGILNRSTNSDSWSWDSNIGRIDYIKNGDIIEFAVPLSLLTNLSDTINIGLISRDENWNVKYLLPTDGLASYTLSSHDVTLPSDIKLHLCDSHGGILNRHLPRKATGTLSNGFTYQDDTYYTTSYNNPNNSHTDTYVLWKNTKNIGEYNTMPKIFSTNGALYISLEESWFNDTKSRVEGDSVIDIAKTTADYSITSSSYLNGMDVYTTQGESSFGISEAKLVVRKSDGTSKDIIKRTSVGSASSTFTPKFHTFYRDNKLFYSFNLEDKSSVKDRDRVIGVVQNATGQLQILSTCN